jgi:hypothetical protein
MFIFHFNLHADIPPLSISRSLFGLLLAFTFAGATLAPPVCTQSDASRVTVSVRVVGLKSDDESVRAVL